MHWFQLSQVKFVSLIFWAKLELFCKGKAIFVSILFSFNKKKNF